MFHINEEKEQNKEKIIKNNQGFLPTDPKLLEEAKSFGTKNKDNNRINILEYIDEEWDNFLDFSESMKKGIDFLGIGFLSYKELGQFPCWKGYFILNFDNQYYLIGAEAINNKTIYSDEKVKFLNIIKLNQEFNELSPFKGVNRIPRSSYNDFNAGIVVDIKCYDYTNQIKLNISKSGDENIELYLSFELDKKTKIMERKLNLSSIEQSIKHFTMLKTLDYRLEKKQLNKK